jgi:acyl transferase domain-containing protein
LDDALRDGNPIRAIIRDSGVNQDGKTETITTPSGEAQEELIRACYKRAGLDPSLTTYFEAHGTGTATGDPIEVKTIASVFGNSRPADQPLRIGSVKTNLGHMEAASGVAAVIKVVLALEKGQIPPSINFKKPNEKLHLEEWRLKVGQAVLPNVTARQPANDELGPNGARAMAREEWRAARFHQQLWVWWL